MALTIPESRPATKSIRMVESVKAGPVGGKRGRRDRIARFLPILKPLAGVILPALPKR
jgi:hypothetical protein